MHDGAMQPCYKVTSQQESLDKNLPIEIRKLNDQIAKCCLFEPPLHARAA